MPHPESSEPAFDPRSVPRRPRVRWWPLVLVWVLVGGALGVVWWGLDSTRQDRVLATVPTLAVGLALSFVWLVLLSRLPGRVRFVSVIAIALLLALLGAFVKIRGVTGDLVPIVSWRWTPEPGTELEGTRTAAVSLRAITPDDFPQFLGPTRDGVLRGIELERDWTRNPPRELWRRPVGAGWASFAIAGDFAYTIEQRGEDEAVTCYALADGAPVWIHTYPARFDTVVGGIGPRSTPALTDDRVYATGGTGILTCVDRATGEPLWMHDVPAENDGKVAEWGYSVSPLILGQLVVVSAGGHSGRSLVAYDSETGALVWRGGDDRSGYASPSLVNLGGRDQILVFNHASVASHDPANGVVLWSWPWEAAHPNVAQPHVLSGDRVFISSGYGAGCEMIRASTKVGALGAGGFEVESLWKNRNLKAKLSNFVVRGENAWGFDDGIFVCLDLATGKRLWKGGRYGHGQVLFAGDTLLVTSETGGILLVDPATEGLRELAEIQAIDGKAWQGPSLNGRGVLLHRNDSVVVCYELPRRGAD